MVLKLPEYNGWRDYFTWAVHLWLSNDENTFRAALSVIRRSRDPEQALKAFVEEMSPLEGTASLYQDCLGYALAKVDYGAIVKALREAA